jgi:ADP-ribosyl-[dinitrogen reductase] hydrolase
MAENEPVSSGVLTWLREREEMYERELDCALVAARNAAAILRPAFHTGYKEELDVSLEVGLRRYLVDAFPEYGYRGEETSHVTPPRDSKVHLWLVDPHDGTHAAAKGHRGAAISIALLRNGVPVLGVVCAYSAPDNAGDLFWWAEGLGPIRRNDKETIRAWQTKPHSGMTVLMSQDADGAASVNSAIAHPMRFRGIPGIAYRLALVAAGEGDLAISLNSPTGWDVAAGHALLLGAGGNLFGHDGSPVTYSTTGSPNVSLHSCYGGPAELVQSVASREWRKALHCPPESARTILAYLEPGKTIIESGVLARAQGCLLGQFAGDALGSLVEFQSSDRIRSKYPNGPNLLKDGGSWDTIAGQPTDDSELALALARSIVAREQYVEEEAALAYAAWYDSHPFDIGNTTRLALSSASDSLHRGQPVAQAAHAHASHSSQANGALMRVSPLAIFGGALQPYEIGRHARTDAGLTHPHEVCRAANAVFAVAISYAIRTGYNAEMIYRHAWSWAHDTAVDTDVLASLEAAEVEAPSDLGAALLDFVNFSGIGGIRVS